MTGDADRLLAQLDLALLDELTGLRSLTDQLQAQVDDLAWELVVAERENVRLLQALAAPESEDGGAGAPRVAGRHG